MEQLRKIIKTLIANWGSSEQKTEPAEDSIKSPDEAFRKADQFYGKTDLVYFKEMNAYGAFKYHVVKDILTHNQAITVSDVHLELNGVYFSLDEEKHQHNKRAAIQHLSFLSKKLKYAENEFTASLFHLFFTNSPKGETFNLVDYVINPMVFINVLNEFGFLELFPEFDPHSTAFSYTFVIKTINEIFHDSTVIEPMLQKRILGYGSVPEKVKPLIDEINKDKDVPPGQLPRFFASMLFASTHSTSSFLSSLVHVVLKNYTHLMVENPDREQLNMIINEVLRIYTPVPYIYRTVRKDVIYDGKNLKTGDTVILFIGAANLDPLVFHDPYKAMKNRSEKHLAFGRGQYACIGQFASYRLAINLLNYLTFYHNHFDFADNATTHELHNAILRIPVFISRKN